MTQIPLLVREKVQFYLHQYYQQRWSEQMKKVNEHYQYSVKEKHHNIAYGGGSTLLYYSPIDYNEELPLEIWSISPRLGYYFQKGYIYSFIKYAQKNIKRPQKYYYSSGYNNPNGFCHI